MKKPSPTMKRPTKKELNLHVQKAMKTTAARMRVNGDKVIAKALHDVWAVNEKALSSEVRELNRQTLGDKQ